MEKAAVLLLDSIGPQAGPILQAGGLKVVESGRGFGKDSAGLAEFIRANFAPGMLRAVCLRSGTYLDTEAMSFLREAGVELIVRFGAGTDNISLSATCSQGILVVNTPGQNATSVAEKTLAMATVLCHKIGLAIGSFAACRAVAALNLVVIEAISDPATKAAVGHEISAFLEGLKVKKADCLGTELYGQNLGVIGCCGAIGTKVCTRAMSLGMRVFGCDIAGREAEGVVRVDLATLLAESDFVTIHVDLNSNTKGLIGSEQIAQMKAGAFLLNLARAGIVDLDAVYSALQSGQLAGFASDVDDQNHPIFGLPGTILTPHIAASTIQSEARCAVAGANQVVSWLTEGKVSSCVNFPGLSFDDQSRNGRVMIVHADQPGLIEAISGYFGDQGINIGTFKTVPGRKVFACSLVGPDKPLDEQAVLALSQIPHVVRVMVLGK